MRRVLQITILALLLLGTASLAVVPQVINHQGRLTNDAGVPLTGEYEMTFCLYHEDVGGAALWTETQTVTITEGVFNVYLGDVTPLGEELLTGQDLYLGVTVAGDSEMTPRQPIATVPYAQHAAVADSALQVSGTGNTFVHWGSSTAPDGSELVYSGFAYGPGHLHTPMDPVVLHGDDPSSYGATAGLLFPMITNASAHMPPGIVALCYLRGAICFSPSPTTVVWGSHNPPAGWEVLYRGYMMSSYYELTGAVGPICVECESFEPGPQALPGAGFLGGVVAFSVVPDGGVEAGKYLKCAVLKKIYGVGK